MERNERERFRGNVTRLYGARTPTQPPVTQAAIDVPTAPQAPTKPVIGEQEINAATKTLMKYRSGKSNLDGRVIESEQWWKLRHWDYINAANANDAKPASSWLFNLIMSKHADALDAYPEPNILPREVDDKPTAKMLSACMPVVLQQNDFEITYDSVIWQKLIQGTGIYGIFWDANKHNGLGDITIQKIDVLNIFWEPGATDIQRSRNVFTLELVDKDLLVERYADVEGIDRVTGKSITPNKYLYDDNVDVTDKVVVVDWYYHKRGILHYCKYVDEIVLYSSENDPQMQERGLYDHALYPFVFDPLFPIEGSPCGYGYIDIGKNVQARIDNLNQAIDKHALMGANPRFFVRQGGEVNEEEYADWGKPFVHVTSSQLGEDSIRAIVVPSLESNYINVLNNMVTELKETTSNRDTNNGGADSGVTAASAIAALLEQAGKISKASTRRAYMAYRQLVMLGVELIRQFYDLPRQFRITGRGAQEEYVALSNQGMQPQPLGIAGVDMGYRTPVFDIEVSAQKMATYTKVAQNEFALQMFQLGVLAPQNADQSLALLEVMDFPHKDVFEEKVRENGTMLQLLAQYQQIALSLAAKTGDTALVEALSQNIAGSLQEVQGNGGGASANAKSIVSTDATTGASKKEPKIVEKARARSSAASQPNA